MNQIMAGAVAMGFAVAGLFFLRFWWESGATASSRSSRWSFFLPDGNQPHRAWGWRHRHNNRVRETTCSGCESSRSF